MLNIYNDKHMKWYKKQIDQILKDKTEKHNETHGPEKSLKPAFAPQKIKPNKIHVSSGLEKRSRPKTDSK